MTETLPLPAFWELEAPADWAAIDFISDLHLAENTPRTFEAWAHHMRHGSAQAVIILGDLFELWVGDDDRHTGFAARCAEVLADAAARRSVAFMAGNRDFLVGGAMLRECGVMALPDPTVLLAFGERLLLAHGDTLCLDDRPYQAFRAQVRSEAWQRDFLSLPLHERHAQARAMRDGSESRKAAQAVADWIDIDRATAVRWQHEANAPTLIHGHTHRPGHEDLAPGFMREVLSDWDLDQADRAEVLRLRRSGLVRMRPE